MNSILLKAIIFGIISGVVNLAIFVYAFRGNRWEQKLKRLLLAGFVGVIAMTIIKSYIDSYYETTYRNEINKAVNKMLEKTTPDKLSVPSASPVPQQSTIYDDLPEVSK